MDPDTRQDTRQKVLIVDDNAELLELLVNSLSRMGGFDVMGSPDGVSGLQAYFEFRPDCVVIDVKMPALNGYQLVKALRGDPSSAATPLIILSALAQDRDQIAGLLSGADRYLVKPVTPQGLVASIHEAIETGAQGRTERLQTLLGN